MAFARVFSAQLDALSAQVVSVETDLSRGLNSFTIVGLGDRAVDEARDRVGSALKNSGFDSPKSKNERTVISLSPADLKKEGSQFDLPIALGYLCASEILPKDLEHSLFVGELTLDGAVLPVRGALPIALAALRAGIREIYVPRANANEASLVKGLIVFPVETLLQVVSHLKRDTTEQWIKPHLLGKNAVPSSTIDTDLGDIIGQESAKRGLVIAAAGGHNLLMYGPPGSGKTMLARAFTDLLPELSEKDALSVTAIHSAAASGTGMLICRPPLRSPHHTASYVSIVGGGTHPRPGEVTLAHKGVLFLDEFPEFDRRVIESLRQPLEDRTVAVTRAKGSALFPADFLLIAAMNPCPCGWKGSKTRPCTCTAAELMRYKRKLSGPLLDRIDISIYVGEVRHEELGKGSTHKETAGARKIISAARNFSGARAEKHALGEKTNGALRGRDLAQVTNLTPEARVLLDESATRLGFSSRAYHRTERLARTIADLATSDAVLKEHVLEAIQYRPRPELFE